MYAIFRTLPGSDLYIPPSTFIQLTTSSTHLINFDAAAAICAHCAEGKIDPRFIFMDVEVGAWN